MFQMRQGTWFSMAVGAGAIALLLAGSACSQAPAPDTPVAQAVATAPGRPAAAREAAGGVSWLAPSAWSREARRRPMRVTTYTIPDPEPDMQGELAVFYFGPGQGGGTNANISRWIGQFSGADGGPPREVSRKTRQVGGLTVTILEVVGTYQGGGAPMLGSGQAKEGYALLGAIVAGPQAPIFFKLTGPLDTVDRSRPQFEALVNSLRLEAS
ncbi:MAG: hypothetical protein ACE5HD_04395 [Acidobacteriota bacterium]